MKNSFLLLFLSIFTYVCIGQDNTLVSDGVFFEGEPYIAINPLNSQHFVVAWMSAELFEAVVIRSKVSMDAGTTWSEGIYIPHFAEGNQSADVSIKFDHLGNVYMAYIDYNATTVDNGAIYVIKSTDGGLSWNTPVEATSINDCPDKLCVDRPWMAIDTSEGPNQGAIYVTSMNASLLPVSPPYNPYFTISTDGGATFQDPMFLDGEDFFAGNTIPKPMPTPVIGADGAFHAIYPSYLPSQSLWAHYYIASSEDLGESFEYQSVLQGSSGISDDLPKLGGLIQADPSDENHLAFFFIQNLLGDADVYMTESLDKGITWTEPLRLNDDEEDNGKMQDLVWADFDNEGNLAVCWRDRRDADAPGYEVPSRIYGTVKWVDSLEFEPNFTVASQLVEHDEVLNEAGNDFMCLELVNDTLNAVWGDVRSGTLKIYLSRMALVDGSISVEEISNEEPINIQIYPNPCQEYIYISESNNTFIYDIVDLQGKTIRKAQESNQSAIFVGNLPSGTYLLRYKNDYESKAFRFIKSE